MRVFAGRWIFLISWGVLLVALLNAGAGFWALKRLERKARTPIRGHFLSHLIQPAFTLRNPSLAWKERLQVLSGTVWVHYDPLSLIFGQKFRVQIGGEDLTVRFVNEWAESQGLGEVRLDRIQADFAFSDQEDPEIFSLHVDSPELQFHFSEKSGNLVKGVLPATEN